jgi:hypothetical protein
MSRSKIVNAIQQYVETKAMFEMAKEMLDEVMEGEQMEKCEYGRYTAYRTEEVRRTIQPVGLLAHGVGPAVVAECATGVNRKKLIERGVDPGTIADCSKESKFVKCYVREGE